MITGAQIRAARALLRWTSQNLSKRQRRAALVLQMAEAANDDVPNIDAGQLSPITTALKEGGATLIEAVGVKFIQPD